LYARVRRCLKTSRIGEATLSFEFVPAPPSTPVLNTENQQGNNPLLGVLAFLETLTNDCEDGRFLIQKQKLASNSSLKFLLLNPAAHFRDIVRDARYVITFIHRHINNENLHSSEISMSFSVKLI